MDRANRLRGHPEYTAYTFVLNHVIGHSHQTSAIICCIEKTSTKNLGRLNLSILSSHHIHSILPKQQDGLQRRLPTANKYIEFLPTNLCEVEAKVVQGMRCRKAWVLPTFDVAMTVDDSTAKQVVLLYATSDEGTWWRAAKKLNLTKDLSKGQRLSLPKIRNLTADLSVVLDLERRHQGSDFLCSCILAAKCWSSRLREDFIYPGKKTNPTSKIFLFTISSPCFPLPFLACVTIRSILTLACFINPRSTIQSARPVPTQLAHQMEKWKP